MLEPWDLCRGRDVFTDRFELNSAVASSSFCHFAPNCSTFSRAREIPIPGVKFPPRPLRNSTYPRGIPDEIKNLPPAKRRKVMGDTDMADLSANYCREAHLAGRGFGLEHPKNSIARDLESWKKLESLKGVYCTEYHTCMFEPSERRKAQVLIHNRESLAHYVGRKCLDPKLCTRTGKPHQSWRPRVRDGRVSSFSTGEEREYPTGFCRAYAQGLRDVADEPEYPEGEFTFLEVFSGPNAPLSREVADAFGVELPAARSSLVNKTGHEVERVTADADRFQTVHPDKSSAAVLNSPEEPLSTVKPPKAERITSGTQHPSESKYRKEAVQSGRQPSYGKRTQLIPDGLDNPEEHLRRAKRLEHPFDSLNTLKGSHKANIDAISLQGVRINDARYATLQNLKREKEQLESSQQARNKTISWTARELGSRPNTLLMRQLQDRLNIEDKEVPKLMEEGMGIIGNALCSPFFDPFDLPPKMSTSEFFGDMHSRSLQMIDRVKRMGRAAKPALAKAIFDKTSKEVTGGTMTGPHSLEFIRSKYGSDFQVVPSFGLEQGTDGAGAPKYRRIDDHTACGNNLVAHRLQKVPMAMVDYVSVLIRAEASEVSSPLFLATEDMKGAYRQVPLLPAHVRYSVTAVYDPNTDSVGLYLMLGQPFGAGHSVPNFCRVAEWLSRCLQKLYHMVVDHFFDDFFVIEPETTIYSAMTCLKETMALLGFQLDPEKSQQPTQKAAVLGVIFNTNPLQDSALFRVEPKPSRLTHLLAATEAVISENSLSPALAASIVGKFGFLTSTLFGKAGRCCTGAIRHRQYQSHSFYGLTQELVTSLRLMQTFLADTPPREVNVRFSRPLVMYTDASDVPGRPDRFVVGACLYDPDSGQLYYTSAPVPPATVARWLPKQSYMGQLELLAAPFGLETWHSLIRGRPLLLFIDNDSAAANLVKGYSPRLDSCAIVGHFWLLAARYQTMIYIDRVESKSNLADDPSRQSNTLLLQLGALWTDPAINSLNAPSTDPALWFGTPFGGGKK